MAPYTAGLFKALRPRGHQFGGFIAHGGVVGSFGHASHAAEPLAKHTFSGGAAPTVQIVARRGQTGLNPKAVYQIVVRQGQVEIACSLVLVAETAGQKSDSGIVEGLQADARGRRFLRIHRRNGERNRHHGLQEAASWQIVSGQ